MPDPIADGKPVVELRGDTVQMPAWYWQKIVRYMLVSDAERKKYEAWRRIQFDDK